MCTFLKNKTILIKSFFVLLFLIIGPHALLAQAQPENASEQYEKA